VEQGVLVGGRQTGTVGVEDGVVRDDGAQSAGQVALGGKVGERGADTLEGGDPVAVAVQRPALAAQAAGFGGHQSPHCRGKARRPGRAGTGA